MRHGLSGRKLGRPSPHRMLMYRNMVTDLLQNESIRTTEPKAKEVRKIAEKVITYGKKGTLHDRRQALSVVFDTTVVKKVFQDLSERYKERNGGYTRIIKLGPRQGDMASMAILELLP